jgi:hypothetical protein
MSKLRIVPVLLGSLLLSGCFLPTHFSVASWAIDGISVIFTKKSVTDHGISAIAQKDCALWRGITEGAVCRENDSITAIADAGDIDLDGSPAITASLTGSNIKKSQDIFNRSIISDIAYKDKSLDQPVSWQNDVVIDHVETIQLASLPVMESEPIVTQSPTVQVAPAIETILLDQVVEEVAIDLPVESVIQPDVQNSVSLNSVSLNSVSLQGNYLVIGSFAKWSNATRFAGWYDELGTDIITADVSSKNGSMKVYRILVGPYTSETQYSVVASVIAAGIKDAWGMKIEDPKIAMNWKTDTLVQLSAVPR